jgi:hypothetical protein
MAVAGKTMLVLCDNCSARVSASVEGSFSYYVNEADITVRFSLLKCQTCDHPILVSQEPSRMDQPAKRVPLVTKRPPRIDLSAAPLVASLAPQAAVQITDRHRERQPPPQQEHRKASIKRRGGRWSGQEKPRR